MRAREFFGNGDSTEQACKEINEAIPSTTATFKPVAVLSAHGILRVHDSRIPHSTRALDELEKIISKYSLQVVNPS